MIINIYIVRETEILCNELTYRTREKKSNQFSFKFLNIFLTLLKEILFVFD